MIGTLRTFGALLCAFVLTLPANAAAATNNGSVLAALRQEQAAIYAIVRDFHMVTLLSGDPVRNAQLKLAIEKAQAAADTLQPGTGNAALDTALTRAGPAWQSFAKLAAANNFAKDGFTDDNLVGDLYAGADTLNSALVTAIAAIPADAQRARGDKIHTANLLLQRTAAAYLKRSAQMSPDIGAEDPFDIGESTRSLDRQMQALAIDLKGDAAIHDVKSKWNFIRTSLANYNEKSVPFIVDRYATQIDNGLQQALKNIAK